MDKIQVDELPYDSGIYTITHVPTGMIYVGASWDMHTAGVRHLAMLRGGKHYNLALQAVYGTDGADLRIAVGGYCEPHYLNEGKSEYVAYLKEQGAQFLLMDNPHKPRKRRPDPRVRSSL